jgi:hypothetical protein
VRAASYALSDMIADKLQIAGNSPAIVVYVRQRYWGQAGENGDIEADQQWYQLSNRALTIEISESVEQFASSFSVTFTNEEGELSPDNYTNKWPNDIKFRGHNVITYARQLYPNNELKIYLGYGDELKPIIHGFVGDTKMSADGKTINVSCMTSYKHLIHQTIRDAELKAPSPANLFDVLKFFFEKAGVTLHGSAVYVPGTTEEWTIKGAKGTRGQAYDEIVRTLIDTTFHYIRPNFDGSCTLMQIPRYLRDDAADVIFDEYVNLTSLEYTITDQDVYCAVAVKAGNTVSYFSNSFLQFDVALGKWREEHLDVPWANTYRKRREVAIAHHTRNLHKWRTMNIGVVGDPRLQLWDRVGVREQTSSQTWVFHIKGIQTMVSDAGFFQVLDLSVNYGYEPIPPSDISPIQVTVDTIRLKIWDWDREDGDLLNIFNNNDTIATNYFIRNQATYVDIPLEYGNNVIVFEGVSCALGILTGRLQVLDTSNNILFDVGSLPDITFPRTNINKNGVYTKRPSATWIVARV